MKRIDISIIIPVYNAERYLAKCIESILNQTKKEIEIIIVNDGSTDSSEKIIKKYSDSRIRYYKNNNQGIGKTRNFGIKKANGKYIMFVDSDDYLEKNACELLFNKATKDKLDIVLCNFFKEYDNEEIEEVHTPFFNNSSLKENPNIISEYLSPWAKLYNRDIMIKNNITFVEDLKYEDAPFVIAALCNAKKIGKIEKSLYYYVVHSNSETTIRDNRCFDIIKIVNIIRNYTKNMAYLKETIDKLTVRILTNYTIQQRMQQDKKTALNFIDEAFLYLKKEVPDYKNDKYYIGRSIIKRTIEKNKLLTKIYVKLYRGV